MGLTLESRAPLSWRSAFSRAVRVHPPRAQPTAARHHLHLSMSPFLQLLVLLPVCLLAAGCADDIEKMKLTEEERGRILALQNPFGSNLVRIGDAGEQAQVLIGLKNCKVYRAEPQQGVVTEWVGLPEIDGSYPIPSACSRERIEYDGTYIVVAFCKTPIGAGGGCAGGISPHRSRDGKNWEVQITNGGWKSLGQGT